MGAALSTQVADTTVNPVAYCSHSHGGSRYCGGGSDADNTASEGQTDTSQTGCGCHDTTAYDYSRGRHDDFTRAYPTPRLLCIDASLNSRSDLPCVIGGQFVVFFVFHERILIPDFIPRLRRHPLPAVMDVVHQNVLT